MVKEVLSDIYKRMKRSVSKSKFIFMLFLTMLYIISILYTLNLNTKGTISNVAIPDQTGIMNLYNGVVYEQSFTATSNKLKGVGVKIGLYGKENNNDIHLTVLDDSQNVLGENDIRLSEIDDNSYQYVYFEKQVNSKNTKYSVKITSNAPAEEAITLWGSKTKTYQGGYLKYNGDLIQNDIIVSQVFDKVDVHTNLIVAYTFIYMAVMISVLLYSKKGLRNKKWIILIYIVLGCFHVFKVEFYANNVAMYPDEKAQLGYVSYIQEEKELIPDFHNIYVFDSCKNSQENMILCNTKNNDVNYLGHPPLYYYLMGLANSVTKTEQGYIINIQLLRIINLLLNLSGLCIFFYIGYKKLKSNPLLHLLYGTICISIPMFSYLGAAVNNDNLVYLGCAIFFLGVFKYLKKPDYISHNLIAFGIVITTFSKVTAGLILLLGTVFFIIYKIYKEKSIKFLYCREMLVTLPVYLIALFYFLFIFGRYGTFQPSLKLLDPEGFKNSSFYLPLDQRAPYDLLDYTYYYWPRFFVSWTSVLSHVSLLKTLNITSIDTFAQSLILCTPILYLFTRFTTEEKRILRFFMLSILLVAGFQFLTAYQSFLSSGYLGGSQTRYYLCILPIISLSICFCVEAFYEKTSFYRSKLLTAMIVCFVVVLFYEDFIYFLMNFTQYLL